MDTITITIPQVKIEIPIKGLAFDTLENMIFDIMQKLVQKVFSKALSDIDTCLRKNRRRGQLENTGKRSKTFLTRHCDVSIARTRYRDKAGHARYLLDESLSCHDRMLPGQLILLPGGGKPNKALTRPLTQP